MLKLTPIFMFMFTGVVFFGFAVRQAAQPEVFEIRAWEIDDWAECSVNGQRILDIHFKPDSGWIDFTDFLHRGENTVRCQVRDDNHGSCYSYKFQIRKNCRNYTLWRDRCCDSHCAKNNELVFDNEIKVEFHGGS
jgi:hypothetical protein